MSASPLPLDLSRLFDEHQRQLLGLTLRITGDFATAEDALQETFVAAVRAAPAFRGDAAPATWLYRIAVREAVRARARVRRDRERERQFKDASEGQRAPGDTRGGDVPKAHERAQWLEETQRLLAALEALPEEQRLCLVLLSVHALTAEEIGEMLAVPAATVYTRAFRARERLRTLMPS